MARGLGETTITISALDRLIDLEPDNRLENPLSRSQSVRLLKNAVRRDLEWLLNSRRIADPPDEGLKELNRSAYVYGLPDLSALTMASSADRNRLVRQILATINLFEPRLIECSPGAGGNARCGQERRAPADRSHAAHGSGSRAGLVRYRD